MFIHLGIHCYYDNIIMVIVTMVIVAMITHTQIVAKATVAVVKYMMLLVITCFHRFFCEFQEIVLDMILTTLHYILENRPGEYGEMLDH